MDQSWKCLCAGRLARFGELPNPHHAPVFVNKQSELQFSFIAFTDSPPGLVQALPEEARSPSVRYTCYSRYLEPFGFTDNYYLDPYERVYRVEQFLKDKLVIFKPALRYGEYSVGFPTHIGDMPDGLRRSLRWVSFLAIHDEDQLKALRGAGSTVRMGPFGTFQEEMPLGDGPHAILVRGRWLVGPFADAAPSTKGWLFRRDEPLRVLDLPTDLLAEEAYVYENLALFAEPVARRMVSKLIEAGEEWDPDRVVAPATAPVIPVSELQAALEESRGEAPGSEGPSPAATDGPKLPISPPRVEEELAFLKHFRSVTVQEGFLYDETDLVHFHTAMKTGSFVLLAGMAGIGKSQLPRLYARALGLNSTGSGVAGRYLHVPVRPTWTDESDVFGYLDAVNNLYRLAETGVVDLLLEAERHPERLYIVCFDEMNLARGEHYLARILSLLDMPAEDRVISLYNPSARQVYNGHDYPPRVRLGPNVLFVGTVNLDESTHTFTDRFLDRSITIELQTLPFTMLGDAVRRLDATEDESSEAAATLVVPETRDQEVGWFASWASHFPRWRAPAFLPQRPGATLTEREMRFFQELHEQLHRADSQLGVSYRTLRQIERYLLLLPGGTEGPVVRGAALDAQLLQRVLPRLRGPREALRSLVGYPEDDGSLRDSSLADLFDEYRDVSAFERSRRRLHEKAVALKVYGYAT